MKTNSFLIAGALLLLWSCNKNTKVSCGFTEGSVVAKDNGSSIEWEVSKNAIKANAMQTMLQIQKLMNRVGDTLVFQSAEVIKENNNDYVLECHSLVGVDKSLTIHIGLKKNNNNELAIEFTKNETGNKTIEGCIGNHCSSCKLNKGKGCSCNVQGSQGNCDHFIIEIPML